MSTVKKFKQKRTRRCVTCSTLILSTGALLTARGMVCSPCQLLTSHNGERLVYQLQLTQTAPEKGVQTELALDSVM